MSKANQKNMTIGFTPEQYIDLEEYKEQNKDRLLKWKSEKLTVYKKDTITDADIIKYALEMIGIITVE